VYFGFFAFFPNFSSLQFFLIALGWKAGLAPVEQKKKNPRSECVPSISHYNWVGVLKIYPV